MTRVPVYYLKISWKSYYNSILNSSGHEIAIVDNMINIPSLLINGLLPFWKQSLKLYIGGHKMYIYPFGPAW